jgi:hypothetical protein
LPYEYIRQTRLGTPKSRLRLLNSDRFINPGVVFIRKKSTPNVKCIIYTPTESFPFWFWRPPFKIFSSLIICCVFSGQFPWRRRGTESLGSSPGLPRKIGSQTSETSHTAPVTVSSWFYLCYSEWFIVWHRKRRTQALKNYNEKGLRLWQLERAESPPGRRLLLCRVESFIKGEIRSNVSSY